MSLAAPFDPVRAEGWRGPHERQVCRWCGAEVPERKRAWCGDDCTTAYLDVLHAQDFRYLRPRVYERDGGICQLCGCAPEALRNMLHEARQRVEAEMRPQRPRRDSWTAWEAYHNTLRTAQAVAETEARTRVPPGFPRSRDRDWWECDHIVPRVEGGQDSMENLRVLCVPCHKAETSALAGRLAAKRRQDRNNRQRAAWDQAAESARGA